MAQGLQVWDESGTLILDPSQRTVRIHGSRNTGTTAGSIVIDTSQGTPFYQAISRVHQFTGDHHLPYRVIH